MPISTVRLAETVSDRLRHSGVGEEASIPVSFK